MKSWHFIFSHEQLKLKVESQGVKLGDGTEDSKYARTVRVTGRW